MLFNSYPFLLLFLPVTLAGFFAAAQAGRTTAAVWLVMASLFFYGWWNPAFVWLLVLSIAFNYLVAAALSRSANPLGRRILLFAGVGVDLLVLGYYKYAGFLLAQVLPITGHEWTGAQIILPLGISFFTFTQIAFLMDVGRGVAAEYDPVHYALFVTYFPHLIAGPVLHHREMMPQFKDAATYRPRAENMSAGLTIFVFGLFKKVVFADRCAPWAAAVFDSPASVNHTFFLAWLGALAYALQIYFDFSGYSDMAVGLSKLFGIDLPLNFDSPYQAVNIIDFWRRWHMTLSRFLRDYLYIPLGGNRLGGLRRHLNLMITMLLGGLWHGAGWTFVVWGGIHGAYLVLNHWWRALRPPSGLPGRWELAASRLLTFGAVVFAWVFFRAADMSKALTMAGGMLGLNGALLPERWAAKAPAAAAILGAARVRFSPEVPIDIERAAGIFALLAFAWFAPNTQRTMERWKPSLGWLLVAAALAAKAVADMGGGVSEFLYYRF